MMILFIKTTLNLDELALFIREVCNIPSDNRSSYHKDQKRYGLNRGGGEYYLFEVLGLELYLIRNAGEVEIEERKDYEYYITVEYPRHLLKSVSMELGEHLAAVLHSNELDVLFDKSFM